MSSLRDRMGQRSDAMNAATKKAVEGQKSSFPKDERIAKFSFPKSDKKASHKIRGRFIPSKEFMDGKSQELMVQNFVHYYRIGTKTEIIKCLTNLGKPCPICDDIWSKYDKTDPELCKQLKPLMASRRWLANFYIINDDEDEENNGKIVLLDVPFQMHSKIEDEVNASGVSPFDLFNAKNFIIEVTKKKVNEDTVPSYESSRFADDPSEFLGGEEKKIDKAIAKAYNLDEFVNADNGFLTADEINAMLDSFSGAAIKNEVKKKVAEKQVNVDKMDIDELTEYMESNNLKIKGWKELDEDEFRDAIKAQMKKAATPKSADDEKPAPKKPVAKRADDDDDDDDDKPAPKKVAAKKVDDDDDDDDEKPAPKKAAAKKPAKDDDDDDDDLPPKKANKKVSKDDDDDDDDDKPAPKKKVVVPDDDDDDDEKPAPKKPAAKATSKLDNMDRDDLVDFMKEKLLKVKNWKELDEDELRDALKELI